MAKCLISDSIGGLRPFLFQVCLQWILRGCAAVWVDLAKEVPLARSCSDLKIIYADIPDGEYCLAAGTGGEEYFLKVYCHMEKTCPQEWLTLPAGGMKSKAETFLPVTYDPSGTTLGRLFFDKLRLNISSLSVMMFDSSELSESTYSYVDERARNTRPHFYPSVLSNYFCYYEPCVCKNNCNGLDRVSLNLQCTPFTLPDNIEIAPIDRGCISSMNIDGKRQILEASCGIIDKNSCGGCGPRFLGQTKTINQGSGDKLLPLTFNVAINAALDTVSCTKDEVGNPMAPTILTNSNECKKNSSQMPFSCGKLPSPPVHNGYWNYMWCSEKEFFYPRKCTIICVSGYKISGKNDTVWCTKSGVYPRISTLSRCEPLENSCESNPCPYSQCESFPGGYHCVCPAGKTGSKCDEDVKECASSPCGQGKCVDGLNGFECLCSAGFKGTFCDLDINECESGPCENFGTCEDQIAGFRCNCVSGFRGVFCEKDIDDCAESPCANGQCLDLVNAFSCLCPAGFTGSICDVEINECSSSPCVYGRCNDLKQGFRCTCNPGYAGTYCSEEIDECASSPCVYGACMDRLLGYLCHCQVGFSGMHCQEKTDICAEEPCAQGECIDEGDHFRCRCEAGFTGKLCQINIDECASVPCAHGDCVDLPNGFRCVCLCGYTDIHCDLPVVMSSFNMHKDSNSQVSKQECKVEGCVKCVDKNLDICEVCNIGFDLVGGQCFGVCQDANCASCRNDVEPNSCLTCDAGYSLRWTGECTLIKGDVRRLNFLSSNFEPNRITHSILIILASFATLLGMNVQ